MHGEVPTNIRHGLLPGFTQIYKVDYFETFSPVTQLNSISVIFSIVVNQKLLMFRLDVKNFLLVW